MKHKVMYVVLIIGMLSFPFILQSIEIKSNRYHQHLEAYDKLPCTDHGEDIFCTHLPLLRITTEKPIPLPLFYDEFGRAIQDSEGHRLQNNTVVNAKIEYFDSDDSNNHLTDSPTVSEHAHVRARGQTSREYEKLNYLLKFKYEDKVTNKKISLSGMTPDSEWALHGPYLDKTLIRNYICYNLAGEIMEYAPNVRFCEVFVNDEYKGVYLLTEKVEFNKNGRINVEKSDSKMDTTSYIVQIDRQNKNKKISIDTFATYSYISVHRGENRGYYQIEYPSTTLTKGQREFIQSDISKFERALYSYAYNDDKYGYKTYIDVDSFIDYFLINEFTLNYDAMGLSTYLYRDIGDKMKLCVWDFNSAFDLYEMSVITPETFQLQNAMWYSYLFKDKEFVDKVVQRYYELRKTYFSDEYMQSYIDETIAYLGPAVERNYSVWRHTFSSIYEGKLYDYLTPEERNPRNYDEAVKQLKNCVSERLVHMDSHIERLYTLCHDSLNKNYNYKKEKR